MALATDAFLMGAEEDPRTTPYPLAPKAQSWLAQRFNAGNQAPKPTRSPDGAVQKQTASQHRSSMRAAEFALIVSRHYTGHYWIKKVAARRPMACGCGESAGFMDKFVIRGGNPLVGTVRVSGAKNSALACMAAPILTSEEVILENIPQVRDIETERRLLSAMGAEVELGYGRAQHRTKIHCGPLAKPVAEYEIVKTMRASALVLGPLVARMGWARVSMPGGCAIGARPIDQHIKGLEKMGVSIAQEHGYLEARTERLKGAHIVFDVITVTGTEDLLMAATLAEGETVMENCAREPEVTDLAALLTSMGAKIEGAGTATIHVKGVSKLHGARHRINPDRIEAGTLMAAGAITGGDLIVANCNPAHLGAPIAKLQEMGARIDALGHDSLRVRADGGLHATDISTEEYPGFPTDMQGQFMALATQAAGASLIKENIFENRFMHVQELVRMGANIKVDSNNSARVIGPAKLSAAAVMCSDLRASASLVLAALVADGESILDRVYHMDRGYERIEEKLRGVGAQIRRMGNIFTPRDEEMLAQ
jgi:UDP-N-acetylglucosamine 1-carboxyvinyltransferase